MKLHLRTKRKSVTVGAYVFAAALLLVSFFVGYAVRSTPASAQRQGERLITLHDRGVTTSFMTDSETIGDALAIAGVLLDEHDAVEPERNEKLIAADYQVNIYRARPVTVIEGSLRQKVITPYQSAERIVSDVGISLYPEDKIHMSRSDDVLTQGSGLTLEIIRATPVELTLYGATNQVRTQAETVEGLLTEKNITLGPNDRASVPLATAISGGMSVRVWREGKQTVTRDEAIPFDIEKIQDADRDVGYREVKTPGVDGQRSVTYEIVVEQGIEVSRVEIASVTKKNAISQVELVGTKPKYMPYTGGGTKTEWLAASNIPEPMWGYADWLVQKESGWNPNARNVSSGACGLAQALPCSKVPGNPLDPVNSLNWMNGYVNGRYGTWEAAVQHSRQKGWY